MLKTISLKSDKLFLKIIFFRFFFLEEKEVLLRSLWSLKYTKNIN